jgi:hypothetical protein
VVFRSGFAAAKHQKSPAPYVDERLSSFREIHPAMEEVAQERLGSDTFQVGKMQKDTPHFVAVCFI